jgi:hypothetical protein
VEGIRGNDVPGEILAGQQVGHHRLFAFAGAGGLLSEHQVAGLVHEAD